MTPDPKVNQTELGKIIRDMQTASDDKAKQASRFNQLAADVVKQGVEDKLTAKFSKK